MTSCCCFTFLFIFFASFLFLLFKPQISNLKPQISNIFKFSNFLLLSSFLFSNLKFQTSNFKPQTSHLKPQISNLKPQISNIFKFLASFLFPLKLRNQEKNSYKLKTYQRKRFLFMMFFASCIFMGSLV
jgi:hypothetical protein